MRLRQRLDNLPVGRKLLAALLVLLAAVLLVANLAFISAAYWITQESMAPQALHTLARLIASPALSKEALHSPASAQAPRPGRQTRVSAVSLPLAAMARSWS